MRTLLPLLLITGHALAKFPVPPGCTEVTEKEFRYVKVVTKTAGSDPNMGEPLKLAFDLQAGNKVDIYWVERLGKVKLFDATRNAVSTVGTIPVFTGGENGLTGIALDPGFKANRWMYFFFAPATPSEFRVSRFTLKDGQLDMASEKPLLKIPEVRTIQHTGGALQFDSYGDLWITVGKNAADHPKLISEENMRESCESSSSNAGDMRGGLLRIHPDDKAPKGYTIPNDNFGEYWSRQFASQGKADLAKEYADPAKVLPEIYVKGTRNAYSISVDPVRRWVAWGEFGINQPTITEEHNLVTHPAFTGFPYWSGNNYSVLEEPYLGIAGVKDPAAPMNNSKWNKGPRQLPPAQPAIHSYLRSGAITGPIYRYDGDLASPIKIPPHFDKAWFVTDWRWPSGGVGVRIYQVSDDGKKLTDSLGWFGTFGFDHPLDFRQGPDGALYVVNYGPQGFTANAQAHIGRIEYTGACRPSEPKWPKPDATGLAMHDGSAGAPGFRATLRSIRVEAAGPHVIRIHDLQGREIHTDKGLVPGEHALGGLLQNRRGIYFVTLETLQGSETQRLLNY